jgi:peptide/nickel transport system permease protein
LSRVADINDGRRATRVPGWRAFCAHNGSLNAGAAVLLLFIGIALLGPILGATDPQAMVTSQRLQSPSLEHWFGTDRLGRDIYSRVVYGTSSSLAVGVAVAVLGCALGTLFGLIAGYVRWLDSIVMRIMDGIMSIPSIMVAIATISVAGASLVSVVAAIAINDVPRVARLVRSAMLSLREEPYVEAAAVLGSPGYFILLRHMLPSVLAPLAVLGTHIAASAMLLEATLSFLGCGLPPDIPTWGNIMADGRILFRIAPWIILFPGLTLAVAVLAINLLGDGLRDLVDPASAGRER